MSGDAPVKRNFGLLRKIDIIPCAYFCLILHLVFEQA